MIYSAYNLPQLRVQGPAEENEGQFEDTAQPCFNSEGEQALHPAEETGQSTPGRTLNLLPSLPDHFHAKSSLFPLTLHPGSAGWVVGLGGGLEGVEISTSLFT